MTKKILIACPIGGKKQYSINLWFQWIANQKYKNYDIAICSNGDQANYLDEMIKQVEIKDVHCQHKKIISLILPKSDQLTTIQKITYSREMLRRYAVKNDYDGIFWLDSDTIPANRDAIKILLDQNKEVISGVYYYKESKVPVVIDLETRTNITDDKIKLYAENQECVEVWGFGYGCLLITGDALKIPFDYDLFGEERTDDFGHCEALDKVGFKRFLFPFVICKHFGEKSKLDKINKYLGLND